MYYDDPLYASTVRHVTGSLMNWFLLWNHEQELLAQAGEENERCTPEAVDEMRHAFRAIAERLVMEDVYVDLVWLTTTWAGIDGNTGRSAYIIDFVLNDLAFPVWGILSFYVTHNGLLWFALPLIEMDDPRYGLATCAVSSVRQAVKRIKEDD